MREDPAQFPRDLSRGCAGFRRDPCRDSARAGPSSRRDCAAIPPGPWALANRRAESRVRKRRRATRPSSSTPSTVDADLPETAFGSCREDLSTASKSGSRDDKGPQFSPTGGPAHGVSPRPRLLVPRGRRPAGGVSPDDRAASCGCDVPASPHRRSNSSDSRCTATRAPRRGRRRAFRT